ncbi:Lrp/AsnC family transcriptional regulator [Rhodococcus sp. NM-2]|uniref:Lrp/AsnC family transcriptional regulator n=1 Tax=Rhodococcus sp. NM-2 TaxID=3401174 RepID=UPI003AAF354C
MPDVTPEVATELDLAITDALQLNPRVDWAELAQTLGHTPKTLARRWKLLTERGSAWVAVVPGPAFVRQGCATFLAVHCRPQAKRDVARALVGESAVATVSSTTGAADFLLDVFVPGMADLARLLDDRIERIDGITAMTSMVALTTYREGSRWRVQALDLEQSTRLVPPTPSTRRTPLSSLDDLDRALLQSLATDGRQSWTDLAARCGTTGPTARRRVERMTDSGRVALRCEGAPELLGPIVPTTFMMTVPPGELNTAGNLLGRMPRCRVVEAVTGTSTIVATMWFRAAAEIAPFEAALTRELPSLVITDRFITLHTLKRGGHVLDPLGRTTGVIPLTAY